jgi:hypothetical protein
MAMMITRTKQMSSVMIFRARQVMIAMGLVVTFLGNLGDLGNASASPNTITVEDPRPVDKAIQELEKRYGWRITYEDSPYSHYSDISVVTDFRLSAVPVQSLSQLQAAQRKHLRLGPKGGSLTFTLPSADPDELGAVEALVKSYNESHRGFEFAVVRGAGLLHVVPRQMTGSSGTLEPVKPVLDTVITIEPRERTAYALLEEICKKISISTNTDVFVGLAPINMLSQTRTSIGGSAKTARSILERLIVEIGARLSLSWRLFYAPDDKTYALNISWVMPASTQ